MLNAVYLPSLYPLVTGRGVLTGLWAARVLRVSHELGNIYGNQRGALFECPWSEHFIAKINSIVECSPTNEGVTLRVRMIDGQEVVEEIDDASFTMLNEDGEPE